MKKKKIFFCDNCGEEIKTYRPNKENRIHYFCCKKCESEFRKKETSLNAVCTVCGKPYHVKPKDLKTTKYCSRKCQNEAKKTYMKGNGNHQYGLTGDNNSSWKGGRKISSYGYVLIWKPEHPFANGDGNVFEHRLVAEKYLLDDENSVVINGKKYLSKEYCIHHIDFDRTNNKPENLMVMKNTDHMSLHSTLRTNAKARKIYKLLTKCDVEQNRE